MSEIKKDTITERLDQLEQSVSLIKERLATNSWQLSLIRPFNNCPTAAAGDCYDTDCDDCLKTWEKKDREFSERKINGK